MIPLAHDFTGETVLVLGGGTVGARKARRFAREATVVVVSPAFADADYGESDLVRAAPDPDEVESWVARTDPALVVAATDDGAVNDAAAAAAREHGCLLNRADHSGGERPVDDVAVLATVREDPVVVGVSTGGSSPALARVLRERIEADLEGAGELATLTADLRERLRSEGVDPADRRAAVRAVVQSPRVWKGLRGGEANVRQITEEVVDDVLGNE